MKKIDSCADIKEKIEDLHGIETGEIQVEVKKHLSECTECNAYRNALLSLRDIRSVKYKMPKNLELKFSAQVRTEIEEKKRVRKSIWLHPRPVLQLILLIIVFGGVMLYLQQSHTKDDLYPIIGGLTSEELEMVLMYYDNGLSNYPESEIIKEKGIAEIIISGLSEEYIDEYERYFRDDNLYRYLVNLSDEEFEFLISQLY